MSEVNCVECGELFETRRKQRICSIPCRQTRAARRRVATFRAADRELIFERADGVCQLCGDPIDFEAKRPDPMSPSVDHIVPIAYHGEHSLENAQAAHWGCNSQKRATDDQKFRNNKEKK